MPSRYITHFDFSQLVFLFSLNILDVPSNEILFLLFQLEDEGAYSSSSSPFHPFKELNRRIGVYYSPITSIRPSLPQTYRTPSFEELEARLIENYKDKDFMEHSSGDSTVDDTFLSNKMGKKKSISKEQSPLRSNPDLEDWIDGLNMEIIKGAPPNLDHGAGPSSIPYRPSSQIPSNEGESSDKSPPLRNKIHFYDDDTLRFSVTPEPSPIPFEHWEVSSIEIDFKWDKYEDWSEAVKKRCRKDQGKLFCVGLSSSCSDEEIQ